MTAVCRTSPSIGAVPGAREPRRRLGDRLARFVGLAPGLRELVLIVGDELRNGLRLLALQLPDRRVGLDQLALVGGELGLRPFQLLLGVVEVDLGADVEVDRLLPGRDALVQRYHQLLLVGDAHVEALVRRQLLRHLPVERLERVRQLDEVGAQDRLLAQPERLWQRFVPRDGQVGPTGETLDRISGVL